MAKSNSKGSQSKGTKVFGITLPFGNSDGDEETKAEAEEPAIPTGRDDGITRSAIGLASAGLALIAALFFVLIYILLPPQDRTRQEHAAGLAADNVAALMNQHVQALQQRLKRLTLSPDLSEAFDHFLKTGDSSRLLNEEPQLLAAFPEAVRVQVVPLTALGLTDLSNSHLNALGPLRTDILRKAMTSKDGATEALRTDSGWQALLAHYNPAGGAIFLNVDSKHFQELLGAIAAGKLQIQLQQTLAGKTQSIASAAAGAASSIAVTRPLKVPGWQVQVTLPQSALDALVLNPLWLWAICGAAMFALLIIALLIAVRTGRLVNTDLATLAVLGKEYQLKGFSDTRERLHKLLRQGEHNNRPAADEQQPPEPEQAPSRPQDLAGAMAIEEVESAAPDSSSGITLPELDKVPLELFRAYDIRGDADRFLTDAVCAHIGAAIGTLAQDGGDAGGERIILSRDGRQSSPRIAHSLIRGLLSTGITVVDIGQMPTPVMHYATRRLEIDNGIEITGSHNPANHNGFKMVLGGKTLKASDIQQLAKIIHERAYIQGEGEARTEDVAQAYIDTVCRRVELSNPLKIAVDASNGVTGGMAPQLFRQLGCVVEELYCDIDGRFPNHPPDPTIDDHLDQLRHTVVSKSLDLGIALDGDGDRVVAVTGSGRILRSDQLLLILAKEILDKHPGATILYDVKCSMICRELIEKWGGVPLMGASGHAPMKLKLAESGAHLGGEFSAHIFYQDHWFGFDDGLYTAARLMRILVDSGRSLDDWLDSLPTTYATNEILLPATDESKFELVDKFVGAVDFPDAELHMIDGVRAEFADGWGLLRASNTGPAVTLRFEGSSPDSLKRIRGEFQRVLEKVDKRLAGHLSKAT